MLTQAQTRTLQFITRFIDEHGYSPTSKEIADGIHIQSRGVVYRYLSALKAEGFIELVPAKHRNIVLCQSREKPSLRLPLLGAIAAGQPVEAIEDFNEVDMATLFQGEDVYALLVKGDSMVEQGILDGDIVICERTAVAEDGDIVVALIDETNATLKRIKYQKKHTITLCPANSSLQPLEFDAKRVSIQGRYIGLLRDKPK